MKDREDFEFEGENFYIKKPSSRDGYEARKLYSRELLSCIESGIKTSDQLSRWLKENKVWTEKEEQEEKNLIEQIKTLETELYQGSPNKKRMTISEGKKKAIEIRKLRQDWFDLSTSKRKYQEATAESIADNARFDFLVSCCSFRADGQKVFKSYEDYTANADSDLAFKCAEALAAMLYDLDKNFQDKLPENSFLRRFNLVDEEGRLIDKDGRYISVEGRVIDKDGYYLNDEGKRVNKDGNILNEDGLLELQVVYTDDNDNELTPEG